MYKHELKKYLEEGYSTAPKWDKHLPDELCAHIKTEEDFLYFLNFISSDEISADLLEIGCDDSIGFVSRIPEFYTSDETREHAKKCGIDSMFGYLAYVIILALGNE